MEQAAGILPNRPLITRILVISWWKKKLITLISTFIWRQKSPWILQRSRASGLNLISMKEIQFRQRWSRIQAFPHGRHPFFLLVFWWLFTARTWYHNEGSAGIASLCSPRDLLSISSFALKCSKVVQSFMEVRFLECHIVSIVFLLCFMLIRFNRSWTCFRLDKREMTLIGCSARDHKADGCGKFFFRASYYTIQDEERKPNFQQFILSCEPGQCENHFFLSAIWWGA